MPQYRFRGKNPDPDFPCCFDEPCNQSTFIKPCPPTPYVRDSSCNANIYDRAIVRYTPDKLRCEIKSKFVLETFSNLILCPINLRKFCGYNFKDGEVVTVEAEDASKCKCSYDICGKNFTDVTPVKIFNIKRVWPKQIRQVTGLVTLDVDNNGVQYYKLTEITDLTLIHPFFRLTENKLFFDPLVIYYEIHNIMSSHDADATLRSLEGRIITATYVDYGKETRDRSGIPIVILEYIVYDL